MAQFAIEIPDNIVVDVITTCCQWLSYPPTIPNPDFNTEEAESESNPRVIANPEAAAQFLNRNVRGYILDMYKAQKVKVASDTARAEAEEVASQITINDPQA